MIAARKTIISNLPTAEKSLLTDTNDLKNQKRLDKTV